MTPTIFNIVVNSVLWATMMEVCAPQEAHHGLGWAVGEQNILFYGDDSQIMGRKTIWFQGALAILVWIFERVGLHKNLGKTN